MGARIAHAYKERWENMAGSNQPDRFPPRRSRPGSPTPSSRPSADLCLPSSPSRCQSDDR